jgi:hypothetical protein
MLGLEEWPSCWSDPADKIRLTGPAATNYLDFNCLRGGTLVGPCPAFAGPTFKNSLQRPMTVARSFLLWPRYHHCILRSNSLLASSSKSTLNRFWLSATGTSRLVRLAGRPFPLYPLAPVPAYVVMTPLGAILRILEL